MATRTALGIGLAIVAGIATTATITPVGDRPLEYRVVELDGKLMREEPVPEVRLREGDVALSGARLRSGWSSSAELLGERVGSRFLIGPRTTVRLASGRPGVLLEVEKGRLRAIFDAIEDGARERLVTTPSAILAVRGTSYAIAVDRSGDTTLVVFDGIVEISDADRIRPPVRVEAGHSSTVRRGGTPTPPAPHRMTPGDWDRGRGPATMAPPAGRAGMPAGGSGSSHHGGGGHRP